MRDAVICEPLPTAVGGFGGALRRYADIRMVRSRLYR